MSNRLQLLANLEVEAREVLGDRASEWLRKPSRLLDGMAPAEVATTQAGMHVVLHELKRAAVPLRATLKRPHSAR